MNIVEQMIADSLRQFLASRADRIVCDHGLLELRAEGDELVAYLTGKGYVIEICVSRIHP